MSAKARREAAAKAVEDRAIRVAYRMLKAGFALDAVERYTYSPEATAKAIRAGKKVRA